MLPLLTSKFVSQHPPLQILTQPHCFVLMHIKWLLYCLDIGCFRTNKKKVNELRLQQWLSQCSYPIGPFLL
ncbi:unnamed protein product [Urochloa humidicola]